MVKDEDSSQKSSVQSIMYQIFVYDHLKASGIPSSSCCLEDQIGILPNKKYMMLSIFIQAFHKIPVLCLSCQSLFYSKNILFYIIFKVFFVLCLHDLILLRFIVYFLSMLACEYCFVYSSLSMALFLCDTQ